MYIGSCDSCRSHGDSVLSQQSVTTSLVVIDIGISSNCRGHKLLIVGMSPDRAVVYHLSHLP